MEPSIIHAMKNIILKSNVNIDPIELFAMNYQEFTEHPDILNFFEQDELDVENILDEELNTVSDIHNIPTVQQFDDDFNTGLAIAQEIAPQLDLIIDPEDPEIQRICRKLACIFKQVELDKINT